MDVIHRATSTNGRFGVVIVSDTTDSLSTPVQGSLVSMGKIDGMDAFKFTADDSSQFIMVGGDLKAVAGASVVGSWDLQSSNCFTIIAGSLDFFAVQSFGYKRRSSDILSFSKGAAVQVPPVVLAAMGVLPCKNDPVVVDIPALDSDLALALKQAEL